MIQELCSTYTENLRCH